MTKKDLEGLEELNWLKTEWGKKMGVLLDIALNARKT